MKRSRFNATFNLSFLTAPEFYVICQRKSFTKRRTILLHFLRDCRDSTGRQKRQICHHSRRLKLFKRVKNKRMDLTTKVVYISVNSFNFTKRWCKQTNQIVKTDRHVLHGSRPCKIILLIHLRMSKRVVIHWRIVVVPLRPSDIIAKSQRCGSW